MVHVFYLLLLPFLISLVIQYSFIKVFGKRGVGIDREDTDKPQRFHELPTPRAGGVGIFIAFIIGVLIVDFNPTSNLNPIYLILSSLPPFLIGYWEDIRANVSHTVRLIIIASGATIGIILLNSIVYDMGLFKLPLWIAIPFTIFAVTGVTNSINIIDGFNGLAGGISIISLLSFGMVSYIHGDHLIFGISIILIAAISGFFLWNFPNGKIFLGDGGAYFIGFLLAQISVLLVSRNPEISPWFPLVILAYPIFEVSFSIYRRKLKNDTSIFEPDAIHLHTLIYKRITRINSKTSIYICLLFAFFNIIVLPFYSSTPILIFIFILFSVTYIYLYKGIVRFKFMR